MFEEGLFGEPRRTIEVQTTTGKRLRNYVAPPVGQQDVSAYHLAIRPKHKKWIPRRDATGTYNCAGMVWASRRTCLTHPEDWELVLCEDGYRKVDNQNDVITGDIVVYRAKSDGEILHVARICEIRYLDAGDGGEKILIPLALSKWDQKCGEDIHNLDDVNLNGGTEYEREIWTDRPRDKDPKIDLASRILYPNP